MVESARRSGPLAFSRAATAAIAIGAALLVGAGTVASAQSAPETGDAAIEIPAAGPIRVDLVPMRLYNGVDRSIDIVLEIVSLAVEEPPPPTTVEDVRRSLRPGAARRAAERAAREREARAAEAAAPPPEIRLMALRHDGVPLVESGPIDAGPHDLIEVMPAIAGVRETVWLQAIVDGAPNGTPLVMQPMLEPIVAVAREVTNVSGRRFVRVTEWVTEEDAWDARAAAARGEPWPPATLEGEPAFGDEASDSADGEDSGADDPSDTEPDAPPSAAERLFTGFRIYPSALVHFETDRGDVVIALRPDVAPNTAWNFRHLAAGGFYRQVPFHRIVPMTPGGDPFVVQAGDPTPGGAGGPGWRLPMELSGLEHDRGVISMARDTAPDSAGSQFFIALSRAGTARLDGSYTAFGTVVEGMRAVEAIAAVPLADVAAGRAETPPIIVDAWLRPAPPRRPVRAGADENADRGAAGADRPAPGRVPR